MAAVAKPHSSTLAAVRIVIDRRCFILFMRILRGRAPGARKSPRGACPRWSERPVIACIVARIDKLNAPASCPAGTSKKEPRDRGALDFPRNGGSKLQRAA